LNDQVGRTGQPDDIAEVLTWLAIGDHQWLNGQHIIVDGGLTAGMRAHWIDRSTSPH
jgi:NAD(P)-dependent dehydrogenase (short-subunit alcohol dehydrogenase family)